jgi:hypothetical protein
MPNLGCGQMGKVKRNQVLEKYNHIHQCGLSPCDSHDGDNRRHSVGGSRCKAIDLHAITTQSWKSKTAGRNILSQWYTSNYGKRKACVLQGCGRGCNLRYMESI